MGNQGTPDMGNSGPFRGELGEVTEGSIRTFCFVRWPGKVKPGTSSYAMFSIMDFLPTFATHHRRQDAHRPADRRRRPDRRAVRQERDRQPRQPAELSSAQIWWQCGGSNGASTSPTCIPPGSGPSASPACSRPARPWPGIRRSTTSRWTRTKISVSRGLFGWTRRAPAGGGREIQGDVKKYPNPPAANLTRF